MKSRAEIKEQAKLILQQQWGTVVVFVVLYLVAFGVLSMAGVGIAALILSGPLTVSLTWAMLTLFRGGSITVTEALTRGFDNAGRKIGGYLWMQLWIFLWSLLFMIPGIVKGFSYAMTTYILGDMPNITAKDALKLSMRMMDGHKLDLFVLYLSFIGWALLSSVTCGLVWLLYAGPYLQLAEAGFYDEVKQDAIRRGILVLVEPAAPTEPTL